MASILLIFGGDVGAGKTTHARLLTWIIRNKIGIRASYEHIKGFHLIARLLLLIILILRYNNAPIRRICKYFSPLRILYDYDKSLLMKLFSIISWLNLIDTVLIVLLRQHIAGFFNRVLIFEDHIVGYANDMLFFLYTFSKDKTKNAKMPGSVAWMLGFRVLISSLQKRNVLLFFLKAPYDNLLERWRKRGTPYEYLEYLAAGRASGKLIARIGIRVVFISTSRPLVKVFSEILRKVRMCL